MAARLSAMPPTSSRFSLLSQNTEDGIRVPPSENATTDTTPSLAIAAAVKLVPKSIDSTSTTEHPPTTQTPPRTLPSMSHQDRPLIHLWLILTRCMSTPYALRSTQSPGPRSPAFPVAADDLVRDSRHVDEERRRRRRP